MHRIVLYVVESFEYCGMAAFFFNNSNISEKRVEQVFAISAITPL